MDSHSRHSHTSPSEHVSLQGQCQRGSQEQAPPRCSGNRWRAARPIWLRRCLRINLYLFMMRWKEHYNLMVPVAKGSIHQLKQFCSLIEIKLNESCLLLTVPPSCGPNIRTNVEFPLSLQLKLRFLTDLSLHAGFWCKSRSCICYEF